MLASLFDNVNKECFFTSSGLGEEHMHRLVRKSIIEQTMLGAALQGVSPLLAQLALALAPWPVPVPMLPHHLLGTPELTEVYEQHAQ